MKARYYVLVLWKMHVTFGVSMVSGGWLFGHRPGPRGSNKTGQYPVKKLCRLVLLFMNAFAVESSLKQMGGEP
jgi:hypothetical protein